MSLDVILIEIRDERFRQKVRWGEQNYPDGTSIDNKFIADVMRERCEENAKNNKTTFMDILTEEVYEAFAESDPVKLRKELIQVAAVAVAWIEAIDRRRAK